MMAYVTRFRVEGRGCFPSDMLRYDSCFPHGSEDVRLIETLEPGDREFRTVRLRKVHAGSDPRITTERWRSFGWAVTIEGTERV